MEPKPARHRQMKQQIARPASGRSMFTQPLSTGRRRLLLAKGLRAFADGLVSVVLPVYLLRLGY